MPDPFLSAFQVVDREWSPGSGDGRNILSIELAPDGLSFCVLDARRFRYLMLQSLTWPRGVDFLKSPLDWFHQLLSKYPLLAKPYHKVNICFFSPGFSMVPIALFEDQARDSLSGFLASEASGAIRRADRMNNLQAFGLYSVPGPLLDILSKTYPQLKLRHASGTLIESTLANARLDDWNADMVLHFRNSILEVLLLREKKLLYYRAFPYQVFDDLLYFLFLVMGEFKLNPKDLSVVLSGSISMDCAIYNLLKRHFDHMVFAARSDLYTYAPAFDQLPHHYFYNLLNLNACG